MARANAYDCSKFHPRCELVDVLDSGGFLYLWCGNCRILVNLQAVAGRFDSYSACMDSPPDDVLEIIRDEEVS